MDCLSVLMEASFLKLSQSTPPSLEGSALALIMIKQMIHLFDIHEYHQKEPKAFALKNNPLQINEDEKKICDTSSNQTSLTISTISASNIDEINLENIPEFSTKSIEIVDELQKLKCSTFKFQIVRSDFYSQELEYRAKNILSAPSIEYLCKSLVMKNTKCINDDCNDQLNSKYYIVVFQYNQKLKQQKLQKFVKKLSNKSNKYFKFSLASLEETKQLTGFEYNCVSPIGINNNIPIIISHHIINSNCKYIWIGSGSLNVKLRIDTQELMQKFPHFVADITR